MNRFPLLAVSLLTAALVGITGCPNQPATNPPQAPAAGGHVHPTEAPHGGVLVAMGAGHEYHAEVVHNDAAKKVDVYFFDQQFQPVSQGIEQAVVQLLIDGQMLDFPLEPVAGAADGVGYFQGGQPLLDAMEQHPDATGRVSAVIGGNEFHGTMEPGQTHEHEEGETHDEHTSEPTDPFQDHEAAGPETTE